MNKKLFPKHKEYIMNNIGYSDYSIKVLFNLIERQNYLQIIYSYNIEVLEYLMRSALEEEDYITCQKIQETVRLHNKATGSNLTLKS